MTKLIMILTLVITLLAFTSTAEGSSACRRRRYPPAQKPHVVFVHGFSSGAYAWYREQYALESFGYDVTALDLKASGIDLTHIYDVHSFDDYHQPLDDFMTQLPRGERVVLVGGSAGGVSVTKVLHDHSDKVLVAVYISATMLRNGYLTCDDLLMGAPRFSENPCHASCPTLPEPSCFPKTLMGWKEVPVKDKSEGSTLGKNLARPGPLRAILTTNFTEASRRSTGVDTVPRVYVKTLLDTVLLPEQQEKMIESWPPCEVVDVDYGHGVGNPQLIAALVANATIYKRR